MRAFVLLTLIAISFWLIVAYYPSTTIEGADAGARAGDLDRSEELGRTEKGAVTAPDRVLQSGVGGFALTRPQESTPTSGGNFPEAAELSPRPVVQPVVQTGQPRAQEPELGADWLNSIEVPDEVNPGEVDLAAALWHAGPREVGMVLATEPGLPRARGILAEAFAFALDGKTRDGLRRAEELQEGDLSQREKLLLRAALQGEGSGPGTVFASSPGHGARAESPLVLAMELSLRAREGNLALERRDYRGASRAFSDVLKAELGAPWAADAGVLKRWSAPLHTAQEQNRWDPKGAWAAVEMVVASGDTPISIRKRYLREHPGSIMCSGLLLRANAVRGYLQPNQKLRIPTATASVLVDLSARWSFYLLDDEVVGSYPVGIGRAGEETPPGDYLAGNKLENPPWMKVGQDAIPFGDPRNPLGTRWIGWYSGAVKTSYGLHGTWSPESIGTPSSDGCIRYHNEDINQIFEILPQGAQIRVRA